MPPSSKKTTTSLLKLQQQRPATRKLDWICQTCNLTQHGLSRCNQYRRMSAYERWNVVKEAGLCFQCLGPHNQSMCTSNTCPLCNKLHHSSFYSNDWRSRLSLFAAPYRPPQYPSNHHPRSDTREPGRKWITANRENWEAVQHIPQKEV